MIVAIALSAVLTPRHVVPLITLLAVYGLPS